MPWESTSTVAPTVEFEAVLTTAALALDPLDDDAGAAAVVACVVACVAEPEPLELLPQAANRSDAARAGTRNFNDVRIRDSFDRRDNDLQDDWLADVTAF